MSTTPPMPFRDAVALAQVKSALVNGNSGYHDLEKALAVIMFDGFQLFQDRQKKYGPNNIARRREVGVLVRAEDKLTRLARHYVEAKGGDMPDESVEDTWMDLMIYAAIGLLLHRGHWPEFVPVLKNAEQASNG